MSVITFGAKSLKAISFLHDVFVVETLPVIRLAFKISDDLRPGHTEKLDFENSEALALISEGSEIDSAVF